MNTGKKWLFIAAGVLLVGLAAVGVVLPLLPTTPLILLAAACFANSSEKCHRWLAEHNVFGPIISNWQENRCIPRRAKLFAIGSILIFGTYALVFAVDNLHLRIIGGIVLLTGLVFVLRIPPCEK